MNVFHINNNNKKYIFYTLKTFDGFLCELPF